MAKPHMTLAAFRAINNNNTTSVKETAMFSATINGITLSAPTQDELISLINKMNVSAPVAARPVSKPTEERLGFKFLTKLSSATQKTIEVTRDKVVVPAEIYVEDQMIPDALTVTATAAGKVSTWTATLAKASKAKADAMRPATETNSVVATLNSMSKEDLVALIASKL